MHNKPKEALIHMSKRKALTWYQAWGIRLIAIVAALIVCAVITSITTGLNPVEVYATMFAGAFGTTRRIWILGKEVAILLCISLALTPAFRMRFWNLGGEGQILMGALGTAACMIVMGDTLPNAVLIPVCIIAAVFAGAVWALIPALCKARWNTNETLFTLMMNYVATQLVAYFVIVWEVPKGSGKIGIINQSSEAGWLPVIAGNRYLLNILCVALLTIAMYIYLTYSKHGYEISVVGESVATARYVGIKVGWTIIRTLMVAWLAKFNPLGMVLSALLLIFLGRGAGEIATAFTLNQSFGDILTGIILFFIIASEFFINYQLHFRGHGHTESKQGGGSSAPLSSGRAPEGGTDSANSKEKREDPADV